MSKFVPKSEKYISFLSPITERLVENAKVDRKLELVFHFRQVMRSLLILEEDDVDNYKLRLSITYFDSVLHF